MAIVQIRDLTFTYPSAQEPTLFRLRLSVEEGEFVVLAGVSGSGKTTLLSLLKPMLAPRGTQTGEIRFDGQPLSALSDRDAATAIGFVMQEPEEQTVCDTVCSELCFGAEQSGMEQGLMRRRVAETADVFGLTARLHALTSSLSGGQLQQVALASVMTLSPRLLLLDEPLSSLDPIAARRFVEQLRMLNREYGVTVVMATHRMEEVAEAADRLLVLENGRLFFDGPMAQAADALCGHPLFDALPQPLQVCKRLGCSVRPLTCRDGRAALEDVAVTVCPAEERAVGETVLCARELWFRYTKQGEDVLKGASLTVGAGDCLCLFGGNGSGKSTLLTCLASLRKAYRGRVNGKRTVWLPQDVRALFTAETVGEELRRFAAQNGKTEEDIRSVASRLGLTAGLSRHPMDISGGERQLAALALVWLAEADAVLLDEPSRSLDAATKARLAAAIRALTEDGKAVVIATHDTVFAAAVATRCAMLFDGQLVCDEAPTAFFTNNRFYVPPVTRMTGALTVAALKEGTP